MDIKLIKRIEHLTISDAISFAPILKMSLKDAKPEVDKFKKKHFLDDSDIKAIVYFVRDLGLST